MQYYVIGPDGSKYGPADAATLKQWVAENRLFPDTMLEDFGSGQRMPASSVPGLFGDQAAPTATATPGDRNVMSQSLPSGSTGPSLYDSPVGNMAPGHYERGSQGGDGSQELTRSFIYLALAFFCCFPVFSPLGIIQANTALAKGNPSAGIARTLHFVVLGLGILGILSYIILIVVGVSSGRVPGRP